MPDIQEVLYTRRVQGICDPTVLYAVKRDEHGAVFSVKNNDTQGNLYRYRLPAEQFFSLVSAITNHALPEKMRTEPQPPEGRECCIRFFEGTAISGGGSHADMLFLFMSRFPYECGFPIDEKRNPLVTPQEGHWECACGETGLTVQVCPKCGLCSPIAVTGIPDAVQTAWNCECGKTGLNGKYCTECGRGRPQA